MIRKKCLAWLEAEGTGNKEEKSNLPPLPSKFTPSELSTAHMTYESHGLGYLTSILFRCHMPPTPTAEFPKRTSQALLVQWHIVENISRHSPTAPPRLFFYLFIHLFIYFEDLFGPCDAGWPLETPLRERSIRNPARTRPSVMSNRMPGNAITSAGWISPARFSMAQLNSGGN